MAIAGLFVLLAAGCVQSPSTEPCSLCHGKGRTATGPCSFCEGRGYRVVRDYEAKKRAAAEENQQRIARGESPLPARKESWLYGNQWLVVVVMVGGLVLAIRAE